MTDADGQPAPRPLVPPPESVDTSPVLTVHARIEAEAGRWVVYLDVVLVPEGDQQSLTRRIGDYPTEARARIVAAWVMRTAHRSAPPSLGF